VRAVEFDAVEAGAFGADRGGDEVLAQLFNLRQRQRARSRFRVVRRTDGLRADQVRGRAHAGVMQLHVGDAARGLDARCEPRQSGQVRVRPAAELAGKALSLCLDVRCASHGGAETALRAQRERMVFVVGERTVDVALQVGERRQHEAILQTGAACHRNRVEQGSHGGGHLPAD
jgi:hypothetical protein